jgi:cell division protein FtsW
MRRGLLISFLLISVFALLGLGLSVLASASSVQSVRLHQDPHFLLYRQLIWVAAGFISLALVQRFDYHYFKFLGVSFKLGGRRFIKVPALTILLYVVSVLTLVLVFIPPVGVKVNGSWRWLDLVFCKVQPSEFAKIVIIIAMSVWLDRIGTKAGTFRRGALLSCALLVPFAGLVICQTDIGATMVICMLAAVLMVVAGVSLKHLIPMAVAGLAAFAGFIVVTGGNRLERIIAWIESVPLFQSLLGIENPVVREQGDHLRASLYAIQSGGLHGVGYTHSLQKYRYLPESHTDFVFPIGAEEFGLKFSLTVVALFMILLLCGMIISCKAPDKLGRYLAFGLTFMIVFQAMFNLAVVTGLAPTKGIALPFFSYGGTSILTIMIAVGLLINVARHSEEHDGDVHTRNVRNVLHDA